MGCNCKTNEKILKIYNDYGKKIKTPWKEHIKFKTEEIIRIIAIFFLIMLFSPIILIVIIVLYVKGNGIINLNKVLKFILRQKNE